MANMQTEKTIMPEQPPRERACNFKEVALGYTAGDAKNEALRCLGCKTRPCVKGCPVEVPIPEFIKCVAEGDLAAAAEIVSGANSLPAVCGRVCPQESQCERVCVRGVKGEPVGIGRLERFVADTARQSGKSAPAPAPKNGKRVAVIGSGPAGLTCAGELARLGCEVTIFEAFHAPGGVLSYGIPEFRLPKSIVEAEIGDLLSMGVTLKTDMVAGKTITVDGLFAQGFDTVFIGVGAGLPSFMDIPGENLIGVYSANEYLTRVNLMKAYREDAETPILPSRRTAVVGGGNVAMDAARCALRMGAEEVRIVYRRGRDELPARTEEIHHAGEEGIRFDFLTAPVSLAGDENGRLCTMRCQKMELGEPDASGRRRPVPLEGSEYDIAVDTVIVAIGTSPNPLIGQTTEGLEQNRRGCLVADPETGATSRPGVYAGGDIATGAATVILAMGAGKKAACAMAEYMGIKTQLTL